MSEIKITNISNREGTSGPVIVGVTSSISTGYAKMPSGDNSQRVGIESGSIRYNSTAKLLEFYDGTSWNFILPAEESANALGVFGASVGKNGWPLSTDVIEYITISTTGNSSYFGNLSVSKIGNNGGCSSSTRGLFAGGYTAPAYIYYNTIEYVTISTTGNSSDFGDISVVGSYMAACSSSTRGIFGGVGSINTIEYVTIATTGNSTDFGDLTIARPVFSACSSSTRGVFGGGSGGGGNNVRNVIDYITIASQGTNATDFGYLLVPRSDTLSCSSSTRGIFAGGVLDRTNYPVTDIIEYLTIASTGDTVNFGDLSYLTAYSGACSSSTRGVFAGGNTPTDTVFQYIMISTTGNSIYFGSTEFSNGGNTAFSNNHGGLL